MFLGHKAIECIILLVNIKLAITSHVTVSFFLPVLPCHCLGNQNIFATEIVHRHMTTATAKANPNLAFIN